MTAQKLNLAHNRHLSHSLQALYTIGRCIACDADSSL